MRHGGKKETPGRAESAAGFDKARRMAYNGKKTKGGESVKKRIPALLLLLCLVLCACSRPPAPAATPSPASPVPAAESPAPASPAPAAESPAPAAPTPTEEPPHEHDFDPDIGLCRGCGFVCPHEAGFSPEGRCQVCGWLCGHERHDPESARCLCCGAQCRHHFGAIGLCEGCGREAPLTGTVLPDEYFEPAEHEGTCLHETLTDPAGRKHEIAVWLPWDYNEETRYNVVLLIHGDGGSCYDWVDKEESTSRGHIQVFRVYDRMVEQHLCQPFLVVGLNNRGMGENAAFGEMLIEEVVLPYLARTYSTWMEGDSHEQIVAAREHIAIGGLSRGSVFTYYIAMQRCLDVAANFCCFSNSYTGTVIQTLNSEEALPYEIRCYVAEIGLRDVAEYNRDHRAVYDALCEQVERIRDGENARFLEIDEGHNFLMWTAAVYNALLLMF